MNYTSMSDKELVKLCRSEDEAAWATLHERYRKAIELQANKFKVRESEKADLISDGLVNGLYNAVFHFDDSIASFKTYAYTCIYRAMVNTCKRRKLKIPDKELVFLSETDVEIEDSANTPEEKIELNEIIEEFEDYLTEKEKNCLVMQLNGYSVQEIAEACSITEKAVESALSRARAKNRKHFGIV